MGLKISLKSIIWPIFFSHITCFPCCVMQGTRVISRAYLRWQEPSWFKRCSKCYWRIIWSMASIWPLNNALQCKISLFWIRNIFQFVVSWSSHKYLSECWHRILYSGYSQFSGGRYSYLATSEEVDGVSGKCFVDVGPISDRKRFYEILLPSC